MDANNGRDASNSRHASNVRNTNNRRHANSYKDGIWAETTATAEAPGKSTALRTLAIAGLATA
jgi:hypothetical protein